MCDNKSFRLYSRTIKSEAALLPESLRGIVACFKQRSLNIYIYFFQFYFSRPLAGEYISHIHGAKGWKGAAPPDTNARKKVTRLIPNTRDILNSRALLSRSRYIARYHPPKNSPALIKHLHQVTPSLYRYLHCIHWMRLFRQFFLVLLLIQRGHKFFTYCRIFIRQF